MKYAPDFIWPPIINSDRVSIWIRMRDIVLTVLAWLVIGFTMHGLIWILFEYLTEPILHLGTVSQPNWQAIWLKISYFIFTALGLVAWICFLASIRSKIINSTKYIKTLPPAVEIRDLEISLGILPADVEHWHELKSVQVFVNSDNRVYKIIPSPKS
jgi:hypothetical protein